MVPQDPILFIEASKKILPMPILKPLISKLSLLLKWQDVTVLSKTFLMLTILLSEKDELNFQEEKERESLVQERSRE